MNVALSTLQDIMYSVTILPNKIREGYNKTVNKYQATNLTEKLIRSCSLAVHFRRH